MGINMDGPNTAAYISFRGTDFDVNADIVMQPLGFMDVRLEDGTEVSIGIPLLAAMGIQMSFAVILESAKQLKKDMKAQDRDAGH